MATVTSLDGARILSWARRAVDELQRRRIEINELNVFPVPDADTGSNMARTMAAAVEEANQLSPGANAHQVAEALAIGAIRGARGNSGIVLSQVIRGVAQAVRVDADGGEVIANALAAAVKFVDRAIADPVEGTVITVLRAASVAANEALQQERSTGKPESLAAVALAATQAARRALANTPSQLEALRAANVVDAGGTGLVILLEALLCELHGDQPGEQTGRAGEYTVEPAANVAVEEHGHCHGAHAKLEVLFMFAGELDKLEAELRSLGDSLVIARLGSHEGKVHIHSEQPGQVIERAFALGVVTDLVLEVLPAEPVTASPSRLLLAVTPPGSLTQLYAQAGATTVAPGEDIVARILAAIRRSEANEVMLLPNGLLSQHNLVAVERATRAFEQSIILLPTVRLVSGIAALTVYDEQQPLATAAFTMSEAAGEMRTAVLHRAPKAGLLQGGAVAKGDIVVSAHGETILIADNPVEAVEKTCKRLLEHSGEQVSVLFDPKQVQGELLESLTETIGVSVMTYPADGLGAVAEIGVE